MKKILVANGPNLNLLGKREPSLYGNMNYEELKLFIKKHCDSLNIDVEIYQSNLEGDIVSCIQETDADAIVINAGAYTHTSIAIRDALLAVSLPTIEVHLSNIYTREKFRHHSYISDVAIGLITGLKQYGYIAAINYLTSNVD